MNPKGSAKSPDWGAHAKEKLFDAVMLGAPLALLAQAGEALQTAALAEPWRIVWIAAPLLALVYLSWRLLRWQKTPQRHWRWVVLLALYCSLFALLSVTDLLSWRTVPEADRPIALRSWLLPLSAGDWRYRIAPRANAQAEALRVVLLDPVAGPNGKVTLRQ